MIDCVTIIAAMRSILSSPKKTLLAAVNTVWTITRAEVSLTRSPSSGRARAIAARGSADAYMASERMNATDPLKRSPVLVILRMSSHFPSAWYRARNLVRASAMPQLENKRKIPGRTKERP